MKRIVLSLLLLTTLGACDNNGGNPIIDICEEGYHYEDGNCVKDDDMATFVVSFDTKQGSMLSPINVANGSSISLPEAVKEGYDFLGWTLLDSDAAVVVNENIVVNEDITLYAKWKLSEVTISFITNEGSMVNQIVQDYNSNVSQPVDPIKDGYIFGGWYRDDALTTTYTFSTMPSENITLYAKWNIMDWSEIELYLSEIIPLELSENVNLPTTYNDFSITWESSDPGILSSEGVYNRPYQMSAISLSAILLYQQQTITKTYNIDVAGYKSLNAPLASSYIYRDYDTVTDAFFKTLDIINCAFITADASGSLSGTAVLNNINTHIMPKAKAEGNWVLFSIAPDSEWSTIASSPTRINNFADNIVDMINTYGFDGVDIDWETPRSDEAIWFTNMMRVVYTKVKENNPNHLVTAAIAGGMWQPPRYDLTNSHQYIDYINMMTYGMVNNNGYYQNALSRSTSFANPLNQAGKTLTSCSIEESIEIYHGYGIPNSKIIVGVAFYGIKQTRSYDSINQTWSVWENAGSVSYSYISNIYMGNSSYTYHYDINAGVPYIMKTDGTVFISFDNPRSIGQKSDYIIEQGLAGMMYWENGLDLTGALLSAMDSGLKD